MQQLLIRERPLQPSHVINAIHRSVAESTKDSTNTLTTTAPVCRTARVVVVNAKAGRTGCAAQVAYRAGRKVFDLLWSKRIKLLHLVVTEAVPANCGVPLTRRDRAVVISQALKWSECLSASLLAVVGLTKLLTVQRPFAAFEGTSSHKKIIPQNFTRAEAQKKILRGGWGSPAREN